MPTSLRGPVLKWAHDSKILVTFGFVKTLHLIKQQFWWISLKKDIESYVASFPIFSAAKQLLGKTSGLLQNMASPRTLWKEISMDFIMELPKSGGNMVFWVVTDFFPNKCILFLALKYHQLKHMYRLHKVSDCIVSDRVQFTSQFWWEFLK